MEPKQRPELLLLAHRIPYPLDRGDRIRTYHILQYVARGCDVSLACLADEPIDANAESALRPYCRRLAVVRLPGVRRWLHGAASVGIGRTATEGLFYSAALKRKLKKWVRNVQFDAVLTVCSGMAPYLSLPGLRDVPLVLDLVDVDSQKWLDYAGVSSGWKKRLYELEGRRLRHLERRLGVQAKAVTLVSEAEAELYRTFADEVRVHPVGNGVDLDYYSPNVNGESNRPTCAFVGALDYEANIDGLTWFCEHVWPTVKQRSPEAELILVGRRPVSRVEQLSKLAGVTLAADVPDVRPYLRRAAVVVAPLRVARGVQNKVLEAMAMARAIIATPQALDGLNVEPNRHTLSATTPAQWCECLLNLFADPERRRELGNAARQFVEREHRWDAQLKPIAELLNIPCALPQSPSQSCDGSTSFPPLLGVQR